MFYRIFNRLYLPYVDYLRIGWRCLVQVKWVLMFVSSAQPDVCYIFRTRLLAGRLLPRAQHLLGKCLCFLLPFDLRYLLIKRWWMTVNFIMVWGQGRLWLDLHNYLGSSGMKLAQQNKVFSRVDKSHVFLNESSLVTVFIILTSRGDGATFWQVSRRRQLL